MSSHLEQEQHSCYEVCVFFCFKTLSAFMEKDHEENTEGDCPFCSSRRGVLDWLSTGSGTARSDDEDILGCADASRWGNGAYGQGVPKCSGSGTSGRRRFDQVGRCHTCGSHVGSPKRSRGPLAETWRVESWRRFRWYLEYGAQPEWRWKFVYHELSNAGRHVDALD